MKCVNLDEESFSRLFMESYKFKDYKNQNIKVSFIIIQQYLYLSKNHPCSKIIHQKRQNNNHITLKIIKKNLKKKVRATTNHKKSKN
jgi:hypothetical protein